MPKLHISTFWKAYYLLWFINNIEYVFIKGSLLCLREFLTTESSLKMMKNYFYFFLKALFILVRFLFSSFGYLEKQLDKKGKVTFKNYDITNEKKDIYNAHIAHYLIKWGLIQSKIDSSYCFCAQNVWHPIQLSLVYLYCQKQLKMRILIKNEIIHVLKSVLKKAVPKNKAHLLKQSIFV